MKNLRKIIALLALIPVMFLLSCKDDDEPTPGNSPYEIMTEYMIENNLDFTNMTDGWITAAPASVEEVPDFINSYYIIDLRSADNFAAGHIEGAINANLENLLDVAANATKPILVACYTGQSAGHAVLALRLSGFGDAKVLKFGMSAWNSSTQGPWAGNTGNTAVGNSNWTTDPVAENETFSHPAFVTNASEGAQILAERVEYMLSKGFQGVNNTDVLASPETFFINNFWAQTDVDHYGHITGAHRIMPLTLSNDEFRFLNPEQTVVSYCWTGQTSSMLTAYLTVLGYEAKSLKFGANGMIFNNLESHKYGTPSVDLPVVTE